MVKLITIAFLCAAPSFALGLWPNPRSFQSGSQALTLSPSFSINSAFDAPSDLQAAISRTFSYLHNDNLERLVVGRGDADVAAIQDAPSLSSLKLILNAPNILTIAQESIKPFESRDEAYILTVPTTGDATIQANSTLGLFRGLTTFSQLWYVSGDDIYTLEAPIAINDKPAYVSLPLNNFTFLL